MSRTCSQCGNNGHNSRTCTDASLAAGSVSGGGTPQRENGIMLFGVRLTTTEGTSSSFRKSASMGNLSQFDQQPPQDPIVADAGYVSDDVVHASGRSRERKRGVPWTEEEHKLFLLGLHKVGKGDWRGISRNFVKTRTPTQVASHAQKYFLRRHNQNRRRRRSSLFDITTDTVMESSAMMEEQVQQETVAPPTPSTYSSSNYNNLSSSTFPMALSSVMLPLAAKPIRPTPILPVPPSSKMANLNLKEKITLNTEFRPPPFVLNLGTQQFRNQSPDENNDRSSPSSSSTSSFQAGNFTGGGDSIISVA
uniref:Putative MYB-related protein 16 n=1 Tax=Arachis hypogaea TaxID=3818 RepID=V5T688_ARAHY|nr:putative MYB-related protein 16 [Arachis hypogaea]